jgi:hypothetical protein
MAQYLSAVSRSTRLPVLVTEQNPGIVFICQTVATRDVQRDLKFRQRAIKSISLGTQGPV